MATADDYPFNGWDQLIVDGIPRTTRYVEAVDSEGGSPTASCVNNRVEVTRTIYVPWDPVEDQSPLIFPPQQAVWDFCGYPTLGFSLVGSVITPVLSRVIPATAPNWRFSNNGSALESFVPFLYCMDAPSIVPMAVPADGDMYGPGPGARYQIAKLTLSHRALEYTILSDENSIDPTTSAPCDMTWDGVAKRYIMVRSRPAVEYLGLAHGSFKFVDDPVPAKLRPAPGTPGQIQAKGRLDVTWHGVPLNCVGTASLPGNLGALSYFPIDVMRGRVNNDVFLGQDAGTLLCEAPDIEPYVNPLGQLVYNVTYHFLLLETPFGHNGIFDASALQDASGPGEYLEISIDGRSHLDLPLITNVENNFAALIETDIPHGLEEGWPVTLTGIRGARGANGTWTVGFVPDATSFTISNGDLPGEYAGSGVVNLDGWHVYNTGSFPDLFQYWPS